MLEPQIRKRIEDWTLILAVWFIETNGRGHLRCGCPVDKVFKDLMACVSGLVVSLEGEDQWAALDLVNATLKDYDLPNVATVFRRRFRDLPQPHGALSTMRRDAPDSPPAIPSNAGDPWIEPFACQKQSRSLNSRPTQRLIEDLATLISTWYRDADIFKHLNCEYDSCAFYRSYLQMMLWTVCTISCLRTRGQRITAARYVDQLLAQSGVPRIFEAADPILEAVQNSADHVEQLIFGFE